MEVEYTLFRGEYRGALSAAFELPLEHHAALLLELSQQYPNDGIFSLSTDATLSVCLAMPLSPVLKLGDQLREINAVTNRVQLHYQGERVLPELVDALKDKCGMMARVLADGCWLNCPVGTAKCVAHLSGVTDAPALSVTPDELETHNSSYRFRLRERVTAYLPSEHNGGAPANPIRLMWWLEQGVVSYTRRVIYGGVEFEPGLAALPSFDLVHIPVTKALRHTQDAMFAEHPGRQRHAPVPFSDVDLRPVTRERLKEERRDRALASARGREMKRDNCSHCYVKDTCNLQRINTCSGKLTKPYLLHNMEEAVRRHYGGIPRRNSSWVHQHFALAGMTGYFRREGDTVRPFSVKILGVFHSREAAVGMTRRDPMHTNTCIANTWYSPEGATGPWVRLSRKDYRTRDLFVVPLKTRLGNYLSDAPSQKNGQEHYDIALETRPGYKLTTALGLLRTRESWISYWFAQLLPLFNQSGWKNYTEIGPALLQRSPRGEGPHPEFTQYPFTQISIKGVTDWRLSLEWHRQLRRDL